MFQNCWCHLARRRGWRVRAWRAGRGPFFATLAFQGGGDLTSHCRLPPGFEGSEGRMADLVQQVPDRKPV